MDRITIDPVPEPSRERARAGVRRWAECCVREPGSATAFATYAEAASYVSPSAILPGDWPAAHFGGGFEVAFGFLESCRVTRRVPFNPDPIPGEVSHA